MAIFNPLHQYSPKKHDCPYCEADRRFRTVVLGETPTDMVLKQTVYTPPPNVLHKPITQTPAQIPVQVSRPQQAPAPKPKRTINSQNTAGRPKQKTQAQKDLEWFEKWDKH